MLAFLSSSPHHMLLHLSILGKLELYEIRKPESPLPKDTTPSPRRWHEGLLGARFMQTLTHSSHE